MMSTEIPTLANHPFFEGFSSTQVELLADCAKYVHFRTGDFIFSEGDAANEFYLIQHGHVALQVLIPGQPIVTVQTIHENDILGWSWLFEPYRWHFHARALDQIDAIAFDGVALREKCEINRDFGYVLVKHFASIITDRLQATRVHMLDIYAPRNMSENRL